MKEQFQKLKHIQDILDNNPSIRFNCLLDKYVDDENICSEALSFINGALYAFKEQQKKIQAAIELLNTPMMGTVSDLLRDLEDVLE